MRLIDADALLKEFSVRAVSARNWEKALNSGNEELVIRADATLAFLTEVKLTIDNAPTVEQSYQAPKDYIRNKLDYSRPQGEWIDDNEDDSYYANCSCCGYQINTHHERGYLKFCPNCGADMRGGRE